MKTTERYLFYALALLFTCSTFIAPYPFSWLVKLLPMALLFIVAVKHVPKGLNWTFVGGIMFSAIGDFLLDFNREHWFVFGLVSFLIAHIFYIISLKPQLSIIRYKKILLVLK